MATSIEEFITRDIEETLSEIQKVNGYLFDLSVERADKVNFPQDGMCVLRIETRERDPQGCLGHETWFVTYVITAYVAVSDAWEQTIAGRLADIGTDIDKALMADPQRNGYALNSEMGAVDPSYDEGGLASIDIEYRVHFRHLRANPDQL